MDTCAIKVYNNENFMSKNFIKFREKTSGTSKREHGEVGNVRNIVLNFYECCKNIFQSTHNCVCTASGQKINAIQVKLNQCTNIMELVDIMFN